MNQIIQSYKIDSDAMYTSQEIANLLRVSISTARKIIRENALKAYKQTKPYLVYGKHLLEFIDKEFN